MTNDKDIITKTNDGYVVELFAKTTVDNIIESIIEGISILEPEKSLVEDEQYSVYKEIIEKMEDRPVMIKAPDIGKESKVLKTQFRAMLRAAKHGDLSILLSKIATINELEEYKETLEKCKKELETENIPYKKHMKIGTIVEIPSVALMSYEIAKECDFLFIETNSLVHHTYGSKKENLKNPELYTRFQPGIIKLIKQAIEGAHDAGVFCGISGEIVENQLYIPLLIGLGIDQFSINLKNIKEIRNVISELNKSDCKEILEEVMQLKTIEDIEWKLKQFVQKQ